MTHLVVLTAGSQTAQPAGCLSPLDWHLPLILQMSIAGDHPLGFFFGWQMLQELAGFLVPALWQVLPMKQNPPLIVQAVLLVLVSQWAHPRGCCLPWAWHWLSMEQVLDSRDHWVWLWVGSQPEHWPEGCKDPFLWQAPSITHQSLRILCPRQPPLPSHSSVVQGSPSEHCPELVPLQVPFWQKSFLVQGSLSLQTPPVAGDQEVA